MLAYLTKIPWILLILSMGCLKKARPQDTPSEPATERAADAIPTRDQPKVDAAKLDISSLTIQAVESPKSYFQLRMLVSEDKEVDYYKFSICSINDSSQCNPRPESPGEFAFPSHDFPNAPAGIVRVTVTPCVRPDHALDPNQTCGMEKQSAPFQQSQNPPDIQQQMVDKYKINTRIREHVFKMGVLAREAHDKLKDKPDIQPGFMKVLSNISNVTDLLADSLAEFHVDDIFAIQNDLQAQVEELRKASEKENNDAKKEATHEVALPVVDNETKNMMIGIIVLSSLSMIAITGGGAVLFANIQKTKSKAPELGSVLSGAGPKPKASKPKVVIGKGLKKIRNKAQDLGSKVEQEVKNTSWKERLYLTLGAAVLAAIPVVVDQVSKAVGEKAAQMVPAIADQVTKKLQLASESEDLQKHYISLIQDQYNQAIALMKERDA